MEQLRAYALTLVVRQHFQSRHKSGEYTVADGGDEPNDTTDGRINGDHSAVARAQHRGELVAARWRGLADEEPTKLVWHEVVDRGRISNHSWIIGHAVGIR